MLITDIAHYTDADGGGSRLRIRLRSGTVVVDCDCLGALPGEIVGGFLREGAVIGGIGSVLGMVLAGLTALGMILFDPQMPPPPGRSEGYPLRIQVDPALYLGAALAIVALCAIAAWLASRRAARKPIVEALGHV